MYFTYCVMCIILTIKPGNNANSQDGIDDGSGVIQQVSTIQNTQIVSNYNLKNILKLQNKNVYQVSGPFVIVFHSDGNPGAIRQENNQLTGNNVNQNARNELGFALDYKITSNCNPIDFVTPPSQQ